MCVVFSIIAILSILLHRANIFVVLYCVINNLLYTCSRIYEIVSLNYYTGLNLDLGIHKSEDS